MKKCILVTNANIIKVKPIHSKRGFIPGSRVKIEIKGNVKSNENGVYEIMPNLDGKSITCELSRVQDKKTGLQAAFFFKFLHYHVEHLHERGYYSTDDLYPAFKVYIQQKKPLWEQFGDNKEFSIKDVNKKEEFSELMLYADMYLTQVMEIDTFEFWKEYETKYKGMGYKR